MSLSRCVALLLLPATVAFAEEPAKTPPDALLVIKAGRVVDPKGGHILTNQAIVIEGERIKAVGAAAEVLEKLPAHTRVIDLGAATVLPGLIDCHTHITAQSEDYYADIFRRSPIDYAVTAHVYARRTLEAGFTTVRDVGAGEFIDIALKRAIDSGKVAGPRIVPAGLAIGATGGHADLSGFSPSVSFTDRSGVADGEDEIRKKVRENIKYGAEWIKIMATAGVLSEEESVGAPQYQPDEMRAAVEEAAMWGRKVAAHAHGTEGIKRAIRAGVASIEHASFIDDEGIALAKERGTWLVMDIYNDDYILAEFARLGFPQKLIEKEKLVGRTQRENFQKAVRAGCRMAYGTDAGVYPHGGNARQFRHMVQWGMTPMQAVQAATVNGAELLGWSDRIGRLAPGFQADLIALKEDPLADVTRLESVDFVVKGGRIYKNRLTSDPVHRLE
ncbi:MAG TPA: amidohydrolase family protein [Opitutaceae bacterium]|nr:amidohydrolase family protein [Opitutaceae bacterium]